MQGLLISTPVETRIIADLDDAAYSSVADLGLDHLILTTVAEEHPGLVQHLATQGDAVWLADEHICIGSGGCTDAILPVADVPVTLNGAALFQIRNVLSAVATAQAIGLDRTAILHGLRSVQLDNVHLPTSLNAMNANGIKIVLDRPSSPMFLGSLLRTVRTIKPSRTFFVLDYRDVASQDETVEVGRMIGRQATKCFVINEHASLASVVALKAGIAQNEITPPIVHTESISKAVMRAMESAHTEDAIVILTSRPQTVYRTLARQQIG